MVSYLWLERLGKTPMELGLEVDEVDPAWWDAMLLIHAGEQTERSRKMEDIGG